MVLVAKGNLEALEEGKGSHGEYQTSEFKFVEALDSKLDSRGRINETWPHRKNHPCTIIIRPVLTDSPEAVMDYMTALQSQLTELFHEVGVLIEKVDGRI